MRKSTNTGKGYQSVCSFIYKTENDTYRVRKNGKSKTFAKLTDAFKYRKQLLTNTKNVK